MGLEVYNENRLGLSTVGFLTDIKYQRRIKNISDFAFKENMTKIMIRVIALSGIKGEVADIIKADIVDMIKTTFFELTFDEIDYAFKLERHLEYPEHTKHYNLFDATYVSTILKKYKIWKSKERIKNNMNNLAYSVSSNPSEEEKNAIMEEAIINGKKEWLENGILELASSRFDYLDNKGIIQKAFNLTDDQWKSIKKRRLNTVKDELKHELETKKASSYSDKISIKSTLKAIENKSNGLVITETKKSLIIDYYEKQ